MGSLSEEKGNPIAFAITLYTFGTAEITQMHNVKTSNRCLSLNAITKYAIIQSLIKLTTSNEKYLFQTFNQTFFSYLRSHRSIFLFNPVSKVQQLNTTIQKIQVPRHQLKIKLIFTNNSSLTQQYHNALPYLFINNAK